MSAFDEEFNIDEALAAIHKRLSARQVELLFHFARGRSPKQVAADFDIDYRTACQHNRQIMRKLGLGSEAELAVFMWRLRDNFYPPVPIKRCRSSIDNVHNPEDNRRTLRNIASKSESIK